MEECTIKHAKKLIFLLCTAALCAALAACGGQSSAPAQSANEEQEIIVFAAASLTETLNTIKAQYEAAHPGVTVVCSYESSGTLKTQIEEDAPCDIFISAGQKQMDALDTEADPAVSTDYVDHETRVDLLENRVVLCVPEGNPANLAGFDDLADALAQGNVLLAMGNSDVPVGQYTQKILAWYGLDETALANAGCITYGTNVKEVTTQITQGSVDCGVIYATDAYSAGLTPVDAATAEMCGQVIYPAAVLKTAAHPEAAREFLDYLQTEEAMKIFESVGFSPVTNG
ncbi:MAG: molybdate ABC transporter substrate-binding protein [Gemmiger sp.]